MKWRMGTVTLARRTGERPKLPARLFGNWAVHTCDGATTREWEVSHAPSGRLASRVFAKLRDAKAHAERLNAIWDGSGVDDTISADSLLSEEQREAIRALIAEARA